MTEIEAVKRLGEQIGYGNIMDIASALWANQLNNEYGFPINESCGAFVPVCIYQLKKPHQKRALDRLVATCTRVTQNK